MLDSRGFDLWAEGYDGSVAQSDEDARYPFAGYRNLLNTIYRRVLSCAETTVLDVGFGTAVLTASLYRQGCTIFGQDFSPKMVELAREKMPEAKLYQGDFSLGLAPELKGRKYDAIIATYSLHHLTDAQKVGFLKELVALLKEGGHLYIGDVAFPTRSELEACMAQAGDEWDEEEHYFVFEEFQGRFPGMTFEPVSCCAGLLTLRA